MIPQTGKLVTVTGPAVEPVTLVEAKAQLRVEHSDEDTDISRLIAAARERCEDITGRAIIDQTLRLDMDRWPSRPHLEGQDRNAIVLPRPPVSSVTSVQYYDTDGVLQTLVDGTDYVVHVSDPETRITPAYGTTWPSLRNRTAAVQVTYVAGYGDASTDVPDILRHGMLMLIEHFNRNKGDEVTGTITAKFDTASTTLFRSHSVNLVA